MLRLMALIEYLNTHPRDDIYSRICTFILSDKKSFQELSISQLAENFFVSPATLSRFARRFGFKSFGDLRQAILEDDKVNAYLPFRVNKKDIVELKEESGKFFSSYCQEIVDAIIDMEETVSANDVDELIQIIHDAKDICVFGFSSSNEAISYLQGGLLYSQKLIFTASTEEQQRDLAKSMSPDSLVIIISSFGNFFYNNSEVHQEIMNSQAKTLLLTQHAQSMAITSMDTIFNVTKKNYLKAGTHPIEIFVDFLVRRYYVLYSEQEKLL